MLGGDRGGVMKKREPVRFDRIVSIATKSEMAWHPDAAKERAYREQGVKIQYADEWWVLSQAEAEKLIKDIQAVLEQLP